MAALRVLPPEPFTGVVESLDLVTDLISVLRDEQAVYQVPDPEYPDWYFSVTKASNLMDGTGISMLEAEQVFAERGGDPERPGKRHRLDCLVWRQERPGEPAWDSWLGRGRPGWHIECTAIALDALGSDFDVQAGGSDLSFPHHPMCAAEARVATGHPFAKVFLHTGMVALDGKKMSKSLGNLVFVSRLLADGIDPMAIRLVLLAHHYRSDWEYTTAALEAAQARLDRWRRAACRRLRSRRDRNHRRRPCPPAQRPRRPGSARCDRRVGCSARRRHGGPRSGPRPGRRPARHRPLAEPPGRCLPSRHERGLSPFVRRRPRQPPIVPSADHPGALSARSR